jgi:hypothetical protein
MQLAPSGAGGCRSVPGAAEACGHRRSHERVGVRRELASNELSELTQRRAARRLYPLVGDECRELLTARCRNASRITPEAPRRPDAGLRQHDCCSPPATTSRRINAAQWLPPLPADLTAEGDDRGWKCGPAMPFFRARICATVADPLPAAPAFDAARPSHRPRPRP